MMILLKMISTIHMMMRAMMEIINGREHVVAQVVIEKLKKIISDTIRYYINVVIIKGKLGTLYVIIIRKKNIRDI